MAEIDNPVIGVFAYGQTENDNRYEKSCNHEPIDEVVTRHFTLL